MSAAPLMKNPAKGRCLTWFDQQATELVGSLPLTISEKDFNRATTRMRIFYAGLPEDSKVWDCEPESIKLCIVKSALTGFFPGGHNPDVDLIPRKDKGGFLQLNWQMSYRGYIRACRRTEGWDLEVVPIFKGDAFGRGRSSEKGSWYEHVPGDESPSGDPRKDWEELRGVLILVKTPDREKWAFLTRGQIQARRNVAQTDNVWKLWPVEQSMKTGCHFAGAREMFPTDDPSRYAFHSDDGMAAFLEPAPEATRPDPEAPADAVEVPFVETPVEAKTDGVIPDDGPEAPLTPEQYQEARAALKGAGVTFVELNKGQGWGIKGGLGKMPASRFRELMAAIELAKGPAEDPAAPTASEDDLAAIADQVSAAGITWGEVVAGYTNGEQPLPVEPAGMRADEVGAVLRWIAGRETE